MKRMRQDWKPGEHVLINGSTGSGKTKLARHLDEIRINNGGFVVVMVGKLGKDETISEDYAGWTRWTQWKKNPTRSENRVLLWPDTDKVKTIPEKRRLQQEVFTEAFDGLSNTGNRTLHIDEGLYTCNPSYLNLADHVGMIHAMGRSSKLTIITLTQRPSHLPLIIYSSASHAFVGRIQEASDLKRLSELGGKESAKSLSGRITAQSKHDFTWIPVATDKDPEPLNLTR